MFVFIVSVPKWPKLAVMNQRPS